MAGAAGGGVRAKSTSGCDSPAASGKLARQLRDGKLVALEQRLLRADGKLQHRGLVATDKVRQGMTREEARRAARVELGGLTQLREAGRERTRALARRDTPLHKSRHRATRRKVAVLGTMLLAAVVLVAAALLPPAPGLVRLVDLPRQDLRDGDPLAGFPIRLDGEVRGTPMIWDLNQDGDADHRI